MALTLEGINLVKQRARAEIRKPKIAAILKAFFLYLATHKNNPDLQFVAFANLTTTAEVIADAAGKLYALYLKKPAGSTVTAWVQGTDHASTAQTSNSTFRIPMLTTDEELIIFPDGKTLAAGLVLINTTAAGGATSSVTADQVSGFAIIGG